MLVRLGLYVVIIAVTASVILGGILAFQVAEDESNKRVDYSKLPTPKIPPTPKAPIDFVEFGLAARPEKTVFVEIPKATLQKTPNGYLGQIAQNTFALAITFAAEHELSLQSQERFRAHDWPKDSKAKWSPYKTKVTYIPDSSELLFVIERPIANGKTELDVIRLEKRVKIDPKDVDEFHVPTNLMPETLRISEEFSRTVIPEFLKTEGYQGEAIKKSPSTTIPPEINDLLEEYHELAQYAAIAKLQKLLATEGESPQLLAALSRACVQFASLTEHLAWPIDRYYKARGLFYAQRLQALYPEDPQAKWTMLYALGLSGFHQCALPLIDQYEKEEEKPDWFPELAAFCRFDFPQLIEIAEKPDSSLFSKYVLALCYLDDYGHQKLEVCSKLLREQPDCIRVSQIMIHSSALGIRVSMPYATNRNYSLTRHKYLNAIPALNELTDLDPKLLAAIKPPRNLRQEVFHSYNDLIAAIRKHPSYAQRSDLQELSELLVQIDWWFAEKLIQKSQAWGIPTEQILGPHAHLLAHHLHKDSYDLYHENDQISKQKADKFTTARLGQHYLLRSTSKLIQNPTPKIILEYSTRLQQDLDRTFFDTTQFRHFHGDHYSTTPIMDAFASKASPHSPTVIVSKLNRQPDKMNLEELEPKYLPHYWASKEIGDKYYESAQFEKATAYAEQLIKIHPEEGTYQLLSNSVYYSEDSERYIEVWKDYIKDVEALGLEHVTPMMRIANYYIQTGDFDAAYPYARAAADTYSGSGLFGIIRFHSSKGEYEKAKEWNMKVLERYPSIFPACLIAAARMGDLEQIDEIKAFMDANGLTLTPASYRDSTVENIFAAYAIGKAEDVKGMLSYQIVNSKDDTLILPLFALLGYDLQGAPLFPLAKRQQIGLNRKLFHLEMIEKISTTKQAPTKEEMARLDEFILKHDFPEERAGLRLLLGLALFEAGHHDLGIPYMKNAAASPQLERGAPHFAAYLLAKRNIPIDPVRVYDIDEKAWKTDESVDKAIGLITLKAYDKALKILDSILVDQPTHSRALRNKAVTLRLKGEDNLAIQKAYEEVLAHEPDAYPFHSNLGFYCELNNDTKSAIEHHKQVLDLIPEYQVADVSLFRLAMIYTVGSDASLHNEEAAKKLVGEFSAPQVRDPNHSYRRALLYAAFNDKVRFDAMLERITSETKDQSSPSLLFLKEVAKNLPYKRGSDWAKQEAAICQ